MGGRRWEGGGLYGAFSERVVDSGGDYGAGYETRTTSCEECIIVT